MIFLDGLDSENRGVFWLKSFVVWEETKPFAGGGVYTGAGAGVGGVGYGARGTGIIHSRIIGFFCFLGINLLFLSISLCLYIKIFGFSLLVMFLVP